MKARDLGAYVRVTVCPFCGAYSTRSCEMLDETNGVCPWEESQPDPDLLLENYRERKRLEKEYPYND